MKGRILDVNAHTTIDHVEGKIFGPDWSDPGIAVLDVDTPDDDLEPIHLELAFDATDGECVRAHADRLTLTAAQALAVAADLHTAARDAQAIDRSVDDATEREVSSDVR